MNPVVSNPINLTNDPAEDFQPAISVDGKRVEFAGIDLKGMSGFCLVGEIYPDLLNNLMNNPANDSNPSWPANCGL